MRLLKAGVVDSVGDLIKVLRRHKGSAAVVYERSDQERPQAEVPGGPPCVISRGLAAVGSNSFLWEPEGFALAARGVALRVGLPRGVTNAAMARPVQNGACLPGQHFGPVGLPHGGTQNHRSTGNLMVPIGIAPRPRPMGS
jgi:hypothetical protein